MARAKGKRKRRTRRARVASSPRLSTEKLVQEAEAAVAAGRFKQAVPAYKELIKRERRAQWLEGLDAAYVERAGQLADKGMFREASVIWEQRAESCGKPLVGPDYLVSLLRSGREERALRLFVEEAERLAPSEQAAVREQLAALALSGRPGVLTSLAEDDPVVRNHAAAQQALRAYCAGDESGLAAALKRIPFRSPYRVFGQILKALDTLDEAPAEAARQLARIPKTSAFARLAQAAQVAVHPTGELAEGLGERDSDTRALVAELRGWSRGQLGFVQDALKKGDSPNAKSLLDLLVRHRSLFSADFARRTGTSLLIDYPQGVRMFSKALGGLSAFDVDRLHALAAERDRNLFGAERHWREALSELEKKPDDEDNRLRSALILRHLVDLGNPGATLDEDSLPDLEESLELDPEDHASWIRLITGYRELGSLKDARRCLQDALARFPEDPDVLLAAVETAIDGGAFKKAARYATSLLALDPINPKVKSILLEAHLAHARKQMSKGKTELARKELDGATSWVRSEADAGKLALVRGILELSAQDQDQARKWLREGVAHFGGGLAGRLHLLLEAERLERRPDSILEYAQLQDTNALATREEILKLVQAIGALQAEDVGRAAQVLASLAKPLKRAVGEAYTRSEMERVCEALHRTHQFTALQAYAKRALKRWRECPVFVYHLLYASHEGESYMLSFKEMDRLHQAIERAHEDGDARTAHRIADWVHPSLPTAIGPIGPAAPHANDLDAMIDQLGIDVFMDMLGASEGAEEFQALREFLDEDELRQLIKLMVSGEDPTAFLDQVFANRGPFPLPRPGKKRKRRAKRKAAFPLPDQDDLFE